MKREILFHCVIPGRPGILKNGKKMCRNAKTGKFFPMASDKYTAWEKDAVRHIGEKSKKQLLDIAMNLQCHFYFTNHQYEPDLDNCYAGVQDVLQKCKVILDDKLIYSHDGSRKIFGAKFDRIEITLTKHVPDFLEITERMN